MAQTVFYHSNQHPRDAARHWWEGCKFLSQDQRCSLEQCIFEPSYNCRRCSTHSPLPTEQGVIEEHGSSVQVKWAWSTDGLKVAWTVEVTGPDYFAVQSIPLNDPLALATAIGHGLNGRVFGGNWAVAQE